ncbi:MAG: trimethyllysine dioxygenase [Tistlia sp.]|uniref:trimethyllysine dioxygenase n=1 Tax=Tistlia sp. TaxID=3057121 RepID=UPI0034A53E02
MTSRGLAAVETQSDALVASLDDGRRLRLPFLWLRDHCACPECLHPEAAQRLVDTFALPAALAPEAVESEPGGFSVRWRDGHLSRHPLSQLADALDDPAPPDLALWRGDERPADSPSLSYEAVMAGDEGLAAWLEAIRRDGYCFVEGVPATAEATERLARRIAYVRETIFGGFWVFSANMAHADTAYTPGTIGPHTDGTYVEDAPGLQLFHCLEFEGEGGESLLIDGFRVAADLKREDPEAYAVLSRVAVPGQYLEEGVHLRAERPVMRHDAAGRLLQVSFNNHDRAPFLLPEPEMSAFYRALGAFWRRLEDPGYQLRTHLDPGRVLIFDNWRVLHGRLAYVGRRTLCGCYLNREDVESRRRVLARRHG